MLLLIVGLVLVAVGAQGVIRLLIDHDDTGLLGWVPGGFGLQLATYLLVALAGAVLAGRGRKTVDADRRDQ